MTAFGRRRGIATELFLLWGLAFLNEDSFGWVSGYSALIPGWRLLSHPSCLSPILRATQVVLPSIKKDCSKENNISLSCRLQWAGCVLYPLCWRLLARACTLLESIGKWALSFRTNNSLLMATSHVTSFLTCLWDYSQNFWIFKEFSFPFSLVDNLAISDCWDVILILFVLTHVWQASQAPHSKYLTNSPLFYKSISSQHTHNCSLSIQYMSCPLPVAFHACSLALKPLKGVNRIFPYFAKTKAWFQI